MRTIVDQTVLYCRCSCTINVNLIWNKFGKVEQKNAETSRDYNERDYTWKIR